MLKPELKPELKLAEARVKAQGGSSIIALTLLALVSIMFLVADLRGIAYEG